MNARPYRILIVEDSPEDRHAYRRRIAHDRQNEYQFWETSSGEEGLRLCGGIAPDCVLLDYQLPDLDGLEFLDRLRGTAEYCLIPVIMLTGHGNEAVAVQAMKKGAQDYLIKGVNSESLIQIVKSAIDKGLLRRQVEEQRADLERLSTERLRLVNELQLQAIALAEASRRKDEFLAMLGHELRNPLAPVRNALHILRIQGNDVRVVEQARKMMERQIVRMSHIIDDLLDVSRIRGGKITLRPECLDLATLVRQTAEDHGADSRNLSIRLNVDLPAAPVWVTVDATRMSQVVENLLANALKFTERNGEVSILLRAETAERRAVLVVRDSGIGIESSMLPHLFDTFAQADRSLDRSRGGLGLGLALVKGLVELHGGTVSAASDGISRGASFTVWLPLEMSAPAPSTTEMTSPVAPTKQRRILVVEDNRDSAESLRIILEVAGYQATVAYSGPEGLESARANCPDAVLCDIGLPGMDGYELAEVLRRETGTAAARLIAITGYGGEEFKDRALRAGFDGHLLKPVDPDILLRELCK